MFLGHLQTNLHQGTLISIHDTANRHIINNNHRSMFKPNVDSCLSRLKHYSCKIRATCKLTSVCSARESMSHKILLSSIDNEPKPWHATNRHRFTHMSPRRILSNSSTSFIHDHKDKKLGLCQIVSPLSLQTNLMMIHLFIMPSMTPTDNLGNLFHN